MLAVLRAEAGDGTAMELGLIAFTSFAFLKTGRKRAHGPERAAVLYPFNLFPVFLQKIDLLLYHHG